VRYPGGKSFIAKKLTNVMTAVAGDRQIYVEPFVGAASILARMAPNFREAYAGDVQGDIVQLWRDARDGWVPPYVLTREEWQQVKESPGPSAMRAFAGFGCSFGAIWFRSYTPAAKVTALSIIRIGARIGNAIIVHDDYTAWNPGKGTLVYCDPPWEGGPHFVASGGKFNPEFWDTVTRWSEHGALVFCSGYDPPEDWCDYWHTMVRRPINMGRWDYQVESLMVHRRYLAELPDSRLVRAAFPP